MAVLVCVVDREGKRGKTMEPTALFETAKRRRLNESRLMMPSLRSFAPDKPLCLWPRLVIPPSTFPNQSRASRGWDQGGTTHETPDTETRLLQILTCCTPAASPRSCVTETLLKFPEGACCSCCCDCEPCICLFDFSPFHTLASLLLSHTNISIFLRHHHHPPSPPYPSPHSFLPLVLHAPTHHVATDPRISCFSSVCGC